jgi:hypothetical protein
LLPGHAIVTDMVTIATGAEPVSRLLRTCGDANVSRDLIMFYRSAAAISPASITSGSASSSIHSALSSMLNVEIL